MQTVITQIKYSIMCPFIRMCIVSLDIIDLHRKNYNIIEIITYDSSMNTRDNPDFIVCIFIENNIGLKRVNISMLMRFILLLAASM